MESQTLKEHSQKRSKVESGFYGLMPIVTAVSEQDRSVHASIGDYMLLL